MVVYKMNGGPYGSQQWFRAKQQFHARWMNSHTKDSQEFIEILPELGPLHGEPDFMREDARTRLWQCMWQLKSFTEVGPTLKLMRWGSIAEVVEFYRPELPALRLILRAMAAKSADITESLAYQYVGANPPVDDAIRKSLSQKSGTVSKAHTYLSTSNIDSIETFVLASRHDQFVYEHRASRTKTPQAGFQWNLALAAGGWKKYFTNVAKRSLYDLERLYRLGCAEESARGDHQCRHLMDLVLKICRERSNQIITENCTHPGCSILAVSPDQQIRDRARHNMLFEFQVLLRCEGLARGHALLREVLSQVTFRNWEWVRLYLHLNELEVSSAQLGESCLTETLLQYHMRIPDEKGAEDLHQFVRDHARARRFTKVAPERIMRACVQSGVPSARGMNHISIDDSAYEHMKPAQLRRDMGSMRSDFWGAPQSWGPADDRILKGETRAAPAESTQAFGVSSWQWLLHYFRDHHGEPNGRPLMSASLAKLCVERCVIHHPSEGFFVVIAQHGWSVLTWRADPLRVHGCDATRFALNRSADAVDIRFILQLAGWRQATAVGAWEAALGVVLQLSQPFDDLLPSALLHGVQLRIADLRFIRFELGLQHEANDSMLNEFERMLDAVFDGRPDDRAAALQLYLEPPQPEVWSPDDATAEALEEICEHDPQAMGELKCIREALRRQQKANIASMLREISKHRAAVAKAKARRPKAKAKAKSLRPRGKFGRRKKRLRSERGPTGVLVRDDRQPEGNACEPGESQQPSRPAVPDATENRPPPELRPPVPEENRRGQQRGQRAAPSWYTPPLLKNCMPDDFKIFLNVGSAHWKIQRRSDSSVATFGFGPSTGRTVCGAAEAAVVFAWDAVGQDRPATCMLDPAGLRDALGPEMREAFAFKRVRIS